MGEDLNPIPGDAFQIHITMLRAESRGTVSLASADPQDKPKIRFNYFSDSRDIAVMRKGFRLTREIIATAPLADYSGEEISPGAAVQSDESIDEFIRASAATAYHPAGSCRMGGEDDPTAVLDAELRVRGIAGLRVVDASVMPAITSSNTNAPTIMVAEKGADLVLGKPAPAPSNAGPWVHPAWETEQR